MLLRFKRKKRIQLANGKRIHLRGIQMFYWGTAAGFLGAAFIAGLYFGVLQADWHIFWLKPWWDNLIHDPRWPVYRHTAFRDIPEPAFATMAVMTLIAKEKYWNARVSTLRLVTAPFILILTTFALGIFGTWLLNYGLPEHARSVLAWHSLGDLALGFLIGKVLHQFWSPIGATLQGRILEDDAARAAGRAQLPFWVRWPLSPPVVRERFSEMYRGYLNQLVTHDTIKVDDEGTPAWIITTMAVIIGLIIALGLAGHYWVGVFHHSIPYITHG